MYSEKSNTFLKIVELKKNIPWFINIYNFFCKKIYKLHINNPIIYNKLKNKKFYLKNKEYFKKLKNIDNVWLLNMLMISQDILWFDEKKDLLNTLTNENIKIK